MNKLSLLPLAAALMLSTSVVPPAFAQDQETKGSPSPKESATPPSSKTEGPSSKSAEEPKGQKKPSESSRDKGSDSKKSADKDTAGSDKSRASDDKPDKPKAVQSDDKKSEQKADTKTDPSPAKKADTPSEPSAKKDAADTKTDPSPAKKADGPSEPSTAKRDAADRPKPDSKDAKQQATGEREKPEKVRSVDLSGDKKERVKTSFKGDNIKRVTNVTIDISVGRPLPRDWDYRPVPITVIELVPEYRGYHYAYVEDRYVIVDPETYEVVYVIESDGGSSVATSSGGAGGSAKCSTDLTFSQEDRTFIIEKVRTTSSASIQIGDLRVGVDLPRDAKVESFPTEVTTRVSKLDRCRYVIIDRRVAVIDPDSDKIVAIIE